MGKAVNVALMVGALVITFELGRETGAKQMFFKWAEAFVELKDREKKNESND